MSLANPDAIVTHLRELQREIRRAIVASRAAARLHEVNRASSADTIYQLDVLIEPIVVDYCQHWGSSLPMVLVAEGIEPETGRVFPQGTRQEEAAIRLIVDPVDGTRGLMYDKRPAWSLAGVAPNRGPATRLRDIEIAVMTELPTAKMGLGDVLWAIKGQGARGQREELAGSASSPLPICPSRSGTIAHGFASVSNFFPGTKRLASQLMEFLAQRLIVAEDLSRALVFDDQYICTGGQFYELIVGHDRFNADLRPIFYAMQNQPQGMSCHPYDCAAWLIAEQAGVILTDAQGQPLDGPLDVTTGLSWIGYANADLRRAIEPLIGEFLQKPRP